MKCSYCGGNTRFTEKFCGGESAFGISCGAPMHRPDCNKPGTRDCNCSTRPFQDSEIDRSGKVFRIGKGWVQE